MSKRLLGAMAVAIAAVAMLMLGGSAYAQENGSREYRVTIENLTDGQPFTPRSG